jgi:hypothetical protein
VHPANKDPPNTPVSLKNWHHSHWSQGFTGTSLIGPRGFALVAIGNHLLLHHVYGSAGLRADAPDIQVQAGFLIQAFNEEIFYRALEIDFFMQWVPSARVISLGTAFLFPVADFLM